MRGFWSRVLSYSNGLAGDGGGGGEEEEGEERREYEEEEERREREEDAKKDQIKEEHNEELEYVRHAHESRDSNIQRYCDDEDDNRLQYYCRSKQAIPAETSCPCVVDDRLLQNNGHHQFLPNDFSAYAAAERRSEWERKHRDPRPNDYENDCCEPPQYRYIAEVETEQDLRCDAKKIQDSYYYQQQQQQQQQVVRPSEMSTAAETTTNGTRAMVPEPRPSHAASSDVIVRPDPGLARYRSNLEDVGGRKLPPAPFVVLGAEAEAETDTDLIRHGGLLAPAPACAQRRPMRGKQQGKEQVVDLDRSRDRPRDSGDRSGPGDGHRLQHYLHRREKNNIAVRKSREKTRLRFSQLLESERHLLAQNVRLADQMDFLAREADRLRTLYASLTAAAAADDVVGGGPE